jgi:hypothetical protein
VAASSIHGGRCTLGLYVSATPIACARSSGSIINFLRVQFSKCQQGGKAKGKQIEPPQWRRHFVESHNTAPSRAPRRGNNFSECSSRRATSLAAAARQRGVLWFVRFGLRRFSGAPCQNTTVLLQELCIAARSDKVSFASQQRFPRSSRDCRGRIDRASIPRYARIVRLILSVFGEQKSSTRRQRVIACGNWDGTDSRRGVRQSFTHSRACRSASARALFLEATCFGGLSDGRTRPSSVRNGSSGRRGPRLRNSCCASRIPARSSDEPQRFKGARCRQHY